MPKTVDKYTIEKSLFQDDFLIQYISCQHKILKKNFTIKKIDKPSQSPNSEHEKENNFKLSYACGCFQNQIAISRQLKSQRVIKCQKILKSKNSIFAVYDEHPQKTLHKVLQTEYLTIQRKENILSDILQLILQLHSVNIAVGNLSPRNLFLTHDYKIRVSNFLLARKIQTDESFRIDSFFLDANSQYYAPQLTKTGTLSKAADIYSLGQIVNSLHFQQFQHELLSPGKSFFDNLKYYIDKMVDLDLQKRPLIGEIKNNLRLNQCRMTSTGNSDSKEQKGTDQKTFGFQSSRSELCQRPLLEKIKSPQKHNYESRKTLMTKKLTLNDNIVQSPRKTLLRYKTLIDEDLHQVSPRNLLYVPQTQRSRQIHSPLSQKSAISSTQTDDSKRMLTMKQKIQEIILLRNVVSFLLQMVQFVYSENKSTKQLVNCLIDQAFTYTENIIKSINLVVVEGDDDEAASVNNLKQILVESQSQKKKLNQIRGFFNSEAELKKQDDVVYGWELKRFGKYILDLYSSNFSLITVKGSQVSSSNNSSLHLELKTEYSKSAHVEQKLFKTLLILKRLQFGSYYEFLKTKIHHFDRKFWKEHYFEFERTFGGKYFVIQIKDLLSRR